MVLHNFESACSGADEAVIMAAEDRGPLMHAHVGMLLALHGATPIEAGGYRFVSEYCLVPRRG